jgi:hypothetical protein
MLSAVVRAGRDRFATARAQRTLPSQDEEGCEVTQQSSGISRFWRKSSASTDAGCVEVRRTNSGVQVRDSKNPNGPILEFNDQEWNAFVAGVALGEFQISGTMNQCPA